MHKISERDLQDLVAKSIKDNIQESETNSVKDLFEAIAPEMNIDEDIFELRAVDHREDRGFSMFESIYKLNPIVGYVNNYDPLLYEIVYEYNDIGMITFVGNDKGFIIDARFLCASEEVQTVPFVAILRKENGMWVQKTIITNQQSPKTL